MEHVLFILEPSEFTHFYLWRGTVRNANALNVYSLADGCRLVTYTFPTAHNVNYKWVAEFCNSWRTYRRVSQYAH